MRKIYDVGPTPLRETLQRLTAEGLVVAHGGRGFQVAELSLAEFLDLNMARIEVELAALRLAIRNGDVDWESRIVAAAYRLARADHDVAKGTEQSMENWENENRHFHSALVSGCPSATLLQMRDALNDKCERYRRAALSNSYASRNLNEEHKAIADAVLAYDSERGCELLRQHYERTLDLLREKYSHNP
jgi:DNA-binding GntR family transcriptional regulator